MLERRTDFSASLSLIVTGRFPILSHWAELHALRRRRMLGTWENALWILIFLPAGRKRR